MDHHLFPHPHITPPPSTAHPPLSLSALPLPPPPRPNVHSSPSHPLPWPPLSIIHPFHLYPSALPCRPRCSRWWTSAATSCGAWALWPLPRRCPAGQHWSCWPWMRTWCQRMVRVGGRPQTIMCKPPWRARARPQTIMYSCANHPGAHVLGPKPSCAIPSALLPHVLARTHAQASSYAHGPNKHKHRHAAGPTHKHPYMHTHRGVCMHTTPDVDNWTSGVDNWTCIQGQTPCCAIQANTYPSGPAQPPLTCPLERACPRACHSTMHTTSLHHHILASHLSHHSSHLLSPWSTCRLPSPRAPRRLERGAGGPGCRWQSICPWAAG